MSPQDGAGQGQSGPKLGFPTGKGERGQNDACVPLQGIAPGYSMSWLWEEDGKTNTISVSLTWGSPQKGSVTQSKAGHSAWSSGQTAPYLWGCNQLLLPKFFVFAALPCRARAWGEEPPINGGTGTG